MLYFFSRRVFDVWNKLDIDLIACHAVSAFKKHLDKAKKICASCTMVQRKPGKGKAFITFHYFKGIYLWYAMAKLKYIVSCKKHRFLIQYTYIKPNSRSFVCLFHCLSLVSFIWPTILLNYLDLKILILFYNGFKFIFKLNKC